MAWAKLHSEEKYFGRRGILLRKPHFLLSPYAPEVPTPLPLSEEMVAMGIAEGESEGRSKMWIVDLSEVTARRREEGEIASEKIVAWSRPRRSSATMEEVAVE